METPVDRRIIKAIAEAVTFERSYAVSLRTIEAFVKDKGQTVAEGYRLLSEFYDALSEGRLKGAYLIKPHLLSLFGEDDSVFFISPVVLSSDQWKTLNTLVYWIIGVSSKCKKLNANQLIKSLIDTLINLWSGERYDKGLYKFAINNGVSESDLADLGIKDSPSEDKEGSQARQYQQHDR
jgi:hypothetical protein